MIILLLPVLLLLPVAFSLGLVNDDPFGLKPTTCKATIDHNEFKIKPNSSLYDYLDPSLFDDPFILDDLGRTLGEGGLVVIKDAFIPEFADYVWEELDSLQWEPFISRHKNGHNMMKHKCSQSSDVMEMVAEVFNHSESKRFVTELSGRDVSGHTTSVSTLYRPGDHSNPHNDVMQERAVTYLWQLSKNWDPRWGGAFYWNHAKHYTNGYQHASYNTLLFFHVTTNSSHGVTPVTTDAKESRYTFGGWFNSPLGVVGENRTRISLDLPIEDWYATEQQRNRLTQNDAYAIVDLDLNKVDDVERRFKLENLQKIVMNQIIAPQIEESVYVLESY